MTRWSLGGVLRWVLAICISLTWPIHSYALGLGDIEVTSALNQPLDAEISLLSVKPDEVSRINVRLADDIAYLTSGVDKPSLLNQLIFTVIEQDGNVAVKVSTRDAVKEPFLDFIIEVNWPSGRLLREYTILLDPPVFAGESAPAVTAPQAEPSTTASGSAANRTSRPATAAESPRPEIASRASADLAPAQGEGSAKSAGVSNGTAAPDEYGPVGRSETLGTIARRIQPSQQYSLEQVMMALYRTNPDAFFDENINNLRAGAVLRTPDDAAIADVSQSQAVQEAREHYRRWLDARQKKNAAGGDIIETEAGLAAMGSDTAGAGRAAAPSTAADGQLRLLSPEDAVVTGRGGEGEGGSGADNGAFSDLAELDNLEKDELQDRIVALESELQKMQRLVTLKDDLLTQFQSRPSGDSEFGVAAEQSTGESAPRESFTQASPAGNAAEQPVSAEQSEPPVEAATGTPPPAIPEEAAPAVEPTGGEASRGDRQSPEKSWASMLMDPQVLALLVGLLLLLGAGGWMMARRRRQAADEYDLPYIADETGVTLPSAAELTQRSQSSPGTSMQEIAPSFAASEEFGAGGLEALETDESEIDPVAEADVYLAYRRFQQAEELIREALRKEPDRQDLQLKMLEIYFGSGNKEAFEAQAEALYAMLGGENNEIWQRVIDMGQELCPDHPLFSGASVPAVGEHSYVTQASAGAAVATATAMADSDDFGTMWDTPGRGFGNGTSGTAAARAPESAVDNPFAALNFESGLGQGSTVSSSGRQEAAQVNTTNFPEDNGLEFDLSGFDFDKLGPAAGESPFAQDEAAVFSNNFSMQSRQERDSQSGQQDFASQSGQAVGGLSSRLMSGNQGEVEEVFTGLDDGAEGEDLFAGSDMVGTKLDLARAYIDMDDRDGARNILHEVIEEGNETQKAEAHELIKKIG